MADPVWTEGGLTPEQAQREYDEAVPVPVSAERIDNIVTAMTDPLRRISQLESELERANDFHRKCQQDYADLLAANERLIASADQWKSENARLRAEITDLCREHMAELWEMMDDNEIITRIGKGQITVGDYRRAVKALEKKP